MKWRTGKRGKEENGERKGGKEREKWRKRIRKTEEKNERNRGQAR